MTVPGLPVPSGHVVLVITGLARGGAEMQVVALAEGLRRRGWRVTMITLQPPRDFVERLAAAGVALEVVDMRGVTALLRAPLRWRTLMRRLRPDVVHTHMVHANLAARLLRLVAPVPRLICTAHSSFEGGRARELAYRLTDRLADLTTQVSRHGADRYARIGAVSPARLRHVPNGTPLPAAASDAAGRTRDDGSAHPAHPFVWLAIGRLVEPKDYPTLLAAFAAVRARQPNVRLRIAGNGHLRESLVARARALGLADTCVEFLGQRDDVQALLRAADAYVISSSWEGLPLAVLEAGAAALPVVATRVGGLPEVIEDGVTGRLVPPGDAEALAEALADVGTMPAAARRALGARLERRVREEYDIERVLDAWESIYRDRLP